MTEQPPGGAGPTLEETRAALLAAALTHAPFDGWSRRAIDAAARDAGITTGLARVAFPEGPADLARAYSAHADRRMVAGIDARAFERLPMRERIAHALKLRLTQAAGEREAVRALMGWLALPGNQGVAARCLYGSVDEIWRAVGDTSTDFSFYTKRATLAAVIGASVLYWLGDESGAYADTRAFIDRRIDDVMGIERAKARAREFAESLPDPFGILRRPRRPPPGPPGAA